MNAVFDLKDDCAITSEDFRTAFGYLDAEEADAAITGMLQAFKDYKAKREPNRESIESFMSAFKTLGDLSVCFANEECILGKQRQETNMGEGVTRKKSNSNSLESVMPESALEES